MDGPQSLLSESPRRARSTSDSSHGEEIEKSVGSLRNGSPACSSRQQKVIAIETACKTQDNGALVELAASPLGLVTDECRQAAWPLLLGCSIDSLSTWEKVPSSTDSSVVGTSWEDLPSHEDENQVGLDVDRSFVYYPKGEGEKQLGSRRDALRGVIVQTLRQHPYLRYFQGYHDIVQVFLLVLGHDRAVDCVARLSLLRIRDFMLPSLAAAMVHLHLIPPILKLVAPELEERLSRTQPFFALSATLTLYAHDIEEYSDIARLFDYFLSQPATVPVYFFAVIIRSRKDELLEVEEDEPEMLHSILSKLPKPLDLEDLIEQTIMLHTQNPPNTLPGLFWHRIDSDSVLKTTQPDKKVQAQTIDQGRRWFRSQQMTLKRRQTTSMISQAIWRYRRPVGSVGIAFTIAVIAILLRRETGSDTYMISAFKRIISLIK